MTVTATRSTPYDWQPGDLITQSRINAVQSNIQALLTPQLSRVANQVTTNTTSAVFADIALVTRTMTTSAACVLVLFQGSIASSAALTADITLLVDGVNQGDTSRGMGTFVATGIQSIVAPLHYHTTVQTAASHIFKMQWKTSAGTLTLQAGWFFEVIELGG